MNLTTSHSAMEKVIFETELVKEKRPHFRNNVPNHGYCATNERGQPLELLPFELGEDNIAECSVYQNSVQIMVKRPVSRMKRSVSSTRGRCKGRSKMSARRFLRDVLKIQRPDLPYHLTLTYEGANVDRHAVYSRHRDNFFRHMRLRFPKCSIVWVIEFHKRGGAHFHLLFWPNEFGGDTFLTPEDEDFLRGAWTHITGGGFYHLENGIHIAKPNVESWDYNHKVRQYIACHQLKTNQNRTDLYTGRTWGFINAPGLLNGKKSRGLINFNFYFIVRRALRRFIFARHKRSGRLTKDPYLKSIKHLLGKAYSFVLNGHDTHMASQKAGVKHEHFMAWMKQRQSIESVKRFQKYLNSRHPVSFNISIWSVEFDKICRSIGQTIPSVLEYVK